MTEADIKTLIETTLAIPVFDGTDTIVYPAATLELTAMTPGILGDGKAKRRKQTAFINLWYEEKTARDTAAIALLEALDASDGIAAPDMDTYYDTTAKKYRAVYNFEVLFFKEEEPEPEPEPEPDPEPTPDPEP